MVCPVHNSSVKMDINTFRTRKAITRRYILHSGSLTPPFGYGVGDADPWRSADQWPRQLFDRGTRLLSWGANTASLKKLGSGRVTFCGLCHRWQPRISLFMIWSWRLSYRTYSTALQLFSALIIICFSTFSHPLRHHHRTTISGQDHTTSSFLNGLDISLTLTFLPECFSKTFISIYHINFHRHYLSLIVMNLLSVNFLLHEYWIGLD